MKYLIFFLLSLSLPAFAQEPKGVTPLSGPSTVYRSPSTMRAVVVGISNYQDPAIPDLQYADSDAVAFATWLQSPGGGRLPTGRLKLLLNEKATRAQVYSALDWLVDESAEGDQAIIYFSGHGDVETKYRNQPGFLLCWDSPPKSYIAGAVQVSDLSEVIIPTLSMEKKVRVLLITDACRAGKLAGSSVNGTAATATALSRQFANETKILSCQPNEVSHEGKQWGGGRGAFSYHLVDGLTGLAAKGDQLVTLSEIDRYLEDHVTPEVAPASQLPFIVGNKAEVLARVDATQLAELVKQKAGQSAGFSTAGGRFAAGIFSPSDSAMYAAFEQALHENRFFEPADNCAEAWFNHLIRNENIASLHKTLRRNFAAALQDEVQQALNALLDDDPYEANNWKYNPAKYREYPEYLQKAMDLLGEKHLMYRSLQAKKLYFEGYNLVRNISAREQQPAARDSLKAAAKAKYLQSLAIEPEAAYTHYALGSLYYGTGRTQTTDSLLVCMQNAVDRSPSWLLPYLDAAEEINDEFNDVPRAEPWLQKAKTFHPESYLLMIRLAWLNQWKNDPETANAICRELIARRPDLSEAWATLATTQFVMQNDWLEAGKSAQEALKLSPGIWYGLSIYALYLAQTNPDSAVLFCENRLRGDPGKEELDIPLVVALIKLRRFEHAESWIQKLQREGIANIQTQVHMQSEKGRLRLLQGRLTEAEAELQKSLDIEVGNIQMPKIQSLALLGEVKDRQQKPQDAEAFFKKAIDFPYRWEQNCVRNEAYFLYGRFLVHQNRPTEAQIQFDNALKISPKTWHYPLGMALLAAKNGRKTATLDWLEKALDRYCFDETGISEEPLFSKIRKTKRFKALMTKHFPPGWAER